MTTGLQIALLGGLLLGTGIALLIWRLAPAQPDLADVARRNSPEGVKERHDLTDTEISTSTERLGTWAIKRLPNTWWGKTPTADLALLRIPLHRHYGDKVLYAIAGLIIPPVLTYVFIVVGLPVPLFIPVIASLALAAVMFALPDFNARDNAKRARAEFARALGAYSDLVALERLGGSGTRQAMELAASVGDSWVFRRISEELSRSRWSGHAPWDALHSLADELRLPELDDIADIMRLSKEGAQVYSQLRARSEGMRNAMLNSELSKANAAGELLSIPITALGLVFLAILITPNLLMTMGVA